MVVAACGGGNGDDSHPLAILAFGLEPEPSLSGFVIDAAKGLPVLPEGDYVLYATDPDGRVLAAEEHSSDGIAAVGLPADLDDADAPEDEAASGHIITIINALIDAELAELYAFEASSSGFTTPLFSDEGEGDIAPALEQMHAALLATSAREEAVTTAFGPLEEMAAALPVAQRVAASNAPVVYPFGVFDSIKDSLFGFFGYAGDAGKRASEDILTVSQTMSPADLEEAFGDIPPGLTGGATNFAELAARLQDGSLNNSAAQIRSQLWRSVPFYASAQSACDCGRPELSTAHKEGAELASRGADLNVTVIKTVLGDVFPDISKGFDIADKANEWAEYAREVYKNPLGAAEGSARDALQEKIKDRIKADLEKCCPDLAEELVEEAAEGAAKEVVNQVPEVFAETPTPSDTETPTPEPTDTPTPEPEETETPTESPTEEPSPTSGSEATPTPDDDETPTATPTEEDESTETPEPDDTETPTPTVTRTSTPTPTPAVAPTATPTMQATISNFAGTWVSAATCDNPEAPNRWRVSLQQNETAVTGTISFHNCPGGGRVDYIVSGTATTDTTITLQGSKAGALGGLGDSAPFSQAFTLTRNGAPSPNLAG